MRRRRERGEERGAEIRVDIKWRGKGFEGRRKEGATPSKKNRKFCIDVASNASSMVDVPRQLKKQ